MSSKDHHNKSRHWSRFLLVGILFLGVCSQASDEGLVEVEPSIDYLAPYLHRRPSVGILFAVGVEHFRPEKYRSVIDDNIYSTIYENKVIPLPEVSLTLRKNFSTFSMGASLDYAMGSVTMASTTKRELELIKKAGSLSLYLDGLWEDPYLVPFIKVQYFTTTYHETVNGASKAGQTSAAISPRFGLMFNLNYLDPDPNAARNGLRDSGLQNTYLSVYYSQNSTSNQSGDPDFESTANWGANVVLEF